ncbi:unnamed protein product [Bursaphelenchus xylophilus]|uniref:(pine wood nematode) hypothetical protein n=1 Tax=Bursaphelenchus xylophilus TaxID=6326 RepID=A0A1I7RJ23_BURXY|nr:unnamed protein product [Bursaphelenchus xylophilus]CAG9119276.1 unnamed protein product [Bursaphelenchus xylophilus]
MGTNEGTEILSKLGILNSQEESPHKMRSTKLEVRRSRSSQRRQRASSLSDDSDDEIVFDRNALLNARKRRRRRRSSSRSSTDLNSIPESKKCKILCLFLTFFVMGMSTSIVSFTKPALMQNVHSNTLSDYSSILTYGGFGFLIGSSLLSWIFTRLNAFITFFLLLVISVPLTLSLIYQTALSKLMFVFVFQQIVFGTIEKGSFLTIHGIFKGENKIFFSLIAAYAFGAGLAATFGQQGVLWSVSDGDGTNIRVKRQLLPVLEVENSTTPYLEVATRPHSAVGIDTDENPKTRENQARRKDNEEKENRKIANSTANLTTKKDVEITTTLATSTTTTTTTEVPSTTVFKKDPMLNFSRSRNRISTEKPSILSGVKEKVKENIAKVSEMKTTASTPYLIIMALSFIPILGFVIGFCACCLRFQLIADVRIAQLDLDAHSYPEDSWTIKGLSFLLTTFQSVPEALLLAGLPTFVHNYVKELDSQSCLLFCSGFWFMAFFVRIFLVWRSSLAVSSRTIKIAYLVGFPTVLLIFLLYTPSEATVFAGLMAIAIFVLPLPLVTSLWSHTQLKNSPYAATTRYFLGLSIAKILAPILAIKGDHFAIGSTIVLSMGISVLIFLFLSDIVGRIGKERRIHQLTGDLNGQRRVSTGAHYTPKPKKNGPYDMLMEEESDADVEMDLVFQNENSESSDS